MDKRINADGLERRFGGLAVVTGTGGLGFEAAATLCELGFEVVLAGRNPQKGSAAVSAIRSRHPGSRVAFERMDLASLVSVADFAARMRSSDQAIDILINNAGIMTVPHRSLTEDGFELQFGVNYLGHFALTAGLMSLLRAASAPRVVHVTSLAHRYAAMDFEDLQNERRYRAGAVYCQSKLAVALFARELQRRSDLVGAGILSVPVHPGFAATELFAAEGGKSGVAGWLSGKVIAPLLGHSPVEAAQSLVLAATSPQISGGELYGPTGPLQMKGAPGPCRFGRQALDDGAARRLWELSEALLSTKMF